MNNTATTTYTFTPTAGQCATTATLTVVITTQVTPAFAPIGPLCQSSVAPTLSSTSNNGYAGTWNPSTINTSTAGTTTYTFTATDPCATTATINIIITNQIIPTFASIGPLCKGSTAPSLPATSINGYAGSWSPATISTSTLGTTTYTFTTTDPCATTATMTVMITTQVTPVFTAIGPLCQASTAPTLPATSTNGL